MDDCSICSINECLRESGQGITKYLPRSIEAQSSAILKADYGDPACIAAQVLASSDHYCLGFDRAPLAVPHLLFWTKDHVPSFAGHIQRSDFSYELMDCLDEITNLYGYMGCQAVFVEHGSSPTEKRGNACISHAHMQVYPAIENFPAKLLEELNLQEHKKVKEGSVLALLSNAVQPYYLVGPTDNSGGFILFEGIYASQLQRMTYAGLAERSSNDLFYDYAFPNSEMLAANLLQREEIRNFLNDSDGVLVPW